MTPKEKRKWIKLLKPYWKLWRKDHNYFRSLERATEELMQKELGEGLEFFYVDGEIAGIGHQDYTRRDRHKKNYFPLIRPEELGGY